jgi:hypothetical protein
MGATFIVLALVFNLVSTSGGRTDTTGIEESGTPADGGE